MDKPNFSEYYAQLSDSELARIASSRRTLVPAARSCLDVEIARRGLTPEDIKRFKNYRHRYREPVSPLQRKIRRSKLLTRVDELRKIPRLGWRGILLLLGCSALGAFAFDHFGVLDLFMPVFGMLTVLLFTLCCHWDLNGKPWYWGILATWAALHVWIIVRVHWPHKWVPARAWEGWTTVDLIALFVIIALVERLLREGRFAPKVREHQELST